MIISMYLDLLLVSVLISIFLMDLKYRKLYFFQLILSIGTGFLINFLTGNRITIVYEVLINVVSLSIFLLLLFLIVRFLIKRSFLEAIGVGDLMFFIFPAVTYTTFTFLILFSFSLLFVFFLFLITKPYLKNKTVPLAGFQALFFTLIILLNSIFNLVDLYAL